MNSDFISLLNYYLDIQKNIMKFSLKKAINDWWAMETKREAKIKNVVVSIAY